MKKPSPDSGLGRFGSLSVLVVEDETLVSFLVEDLLRELGCAEVWHAAAIDEALAMIEMRRPDAGVLDVNLAGRLVYPVAERMEADAIPFVFATGYGRDGLDQRWRECPVLQKPFSLEALAAALDSALER